jgi:hypothetical protein
MSAAPPLAVEALARIARGLPAFEASTIADQHTEMRRAALVWLRARRFVVTDQSKSPLDYTPPEWRNERARGSAHRKQKPIFVPTATDAGRDFLATVAS